jgi:phosphomannomutase
MKSVSGIRGIVGETFTPELILQVGAALASYLDKGTVIVGRDTRPTGPAITQGIISALSLHGSDVVDIGVVPTPTVQVMVEELGASGGVVVSASHNPIEWNAFKLIGSSGTFLKADEIKSFFSLMKNTPQPEGWERVGHIVSDERARDIHEQGHDSDQLPFSEKEEIQGCP